MNETTLTALAAVLLGGPAVMFTPFWLGHLASERHANTTAEAIRQAETRPSADRPKELAR
ncbi:hypothetical protein COO58_17535 [Micromonospora sp. WMMA1996]|uniref:hypothetical protein n=1 Tax=Micromonospora sp. WMMA1996 TaxID=2039878 RepID=UPI000BF7E8F9|nr:hypothetical protein [Micromonospora sp. WMMA1996]PGH46012.1 hypothetical protein COO58_17535 [Micromonospora sp. WMMA1996]